MVEAIELWQCAGCGRIEAPQPCIGVCRDHKLRMVDAADYEALRVEYERAAAVLRMIAASTPSEGRCIQHWRALQVRAREVLASAAD